MKRRIRSIFILMTVCILGINVFQGYWLYSTYMLHHQQFNRTATEALISALEKIQDADAQKIFNTKLSAHERPLLLYKQLERTELVSGQVRVLEKTDSITHIPAEDSLVTMPGRDIIRYKQFSGKDTFFRSLPADTLARRISSRLIVNWYNNTPIDLKKMDSTYRQELALREVEAEFMFDTLHPRTLQAGFPIFANQPTQEYPIQIRPVPVNPVHYLFIQASFKRPLSYVLQKMSWLLACSLLLLVLTTGCFLYMLSTILKQKKLSEIKNDFINNMTHELKTPIATVSAAIEGMLSFGALQDAQKTQLYLTVSKNELQRLSELVEKVLHMAVEEKTDLAIHPEPLNPTELIREIIAHHQLKAPKPVEFVVDIPSETPSVRADRLHLGNTINNLIDNAIKYSYQQVTIQISSKYESNTWRLSVRDSGMGIPKSYHQVIFERFFRIPTGDLHQVKGFGLGLSYVKQVVEKHGGHIEVFSEPAHGSEFVLWFPIHQ